MESEEASEEFDTLRGKQGSVNDGSDDEQRIAGAPIATKVEERGVETAKGVCTHAPMTDEHFQVAVNRMTRITSKRDRPDIQEPNASKRALLYSQEPQWQDFLQEQLGSVKRWTRTGNDSGDNASFSEVL